MLIPIVQRKKVWRSFRYTTHILANRPDLVGTVPIWKPKPDVPPDDPKKPIRPDLSRSTPKNTIVNLPFTCSLYSSVGIQVSCVFWPYFMYPSVAGSYPNKNLYWVKKSMPEYSTLKSWSISSKRFELEYSSSVVGTKTNLFIIIVICFTRITK